MSALMNFLLENPVDNLTREVVISARLKDHPLTIRAMSGGEFSEYQRMAVALAAGRKGRGEFNARTFQEQVVINHTVDPNFKDAEALRKAGCATPEQLLNKTLLAGEIVTLSRLITELSGFGQSMDELVDDAKNS